MKFRIPKLAKSYAIVAVTLSLTIFSLTLSACKFNFGKKKEVSVDLSSLKLDQTEEIKIGIFQPLSGKESAGGILTEEGILLAHEERPYILGKKVVLVTGDSNSTVEGAEEAAKRLVEKGCIGIVGSYGSAFSIAGGKIFREAGIPAVGCSPTNPMVTKGNPYYFRVCFIDPFQGSVAANFCRQKLAAKRALLVTTEGDPYSQGLSETFTNSYPNPSFGSEIINTVIIQPDQTDFSDLISDIMSLNPEVIYAPGSFKLCGRMVHAIRTAGILTPIVGGDTWETDDFVKAAGAKHAGKSVYFTAHFSSYADINDISIKFVSAFRDKFKREPSAFAALGYDAYMLLMECIDRAASEDPKVIRDNLANTKLYIGVTGIITLDENGDASKDAVILSIINGRFSYMQKISPLGDQSTSPMGFGAPVENTSNNEDNSTDNSDEEEQKTDRWGDPVNDESDDSDESGTDNSDSDDESQENSEDNADDTSDNNSDDN